MDEHGDPQRAAEIAQAQRHMSGLALKMMQLFGPIDAAGVLIGAGIGVLRMHLGEEQANEYLTKLAQEANEGGVEPEQAGRA